MKPAQFFLTQQLTPGLINGLINGLIAWSMHRHTAALGLWTQGAYAIDLMATGFLLPAISWLILRPLLGRQLRQGTAPQLEALPPPKLLKFMPRGLWTGTLVIGLMGMTLVGGVCVVLLQLLGSPDIVGSDYAWFKGLFGMLLTLVLQPTMVFAAMKHAKDLASQSSAD